MKDLLFYTNIIIHYGMLAGIVYSIARPVNRIWPPPKKQSWQYFGTWALFYVAVSLTAVLALLTWDTWIISPEIRYYIGIPASLIGGALACWGIVTLGIENTSGSADGVIDNGPYQFTRNPQYLGDIVLFIGLAIVANSLYVAILLSLQVIIFAITPFSEEVWLQDRYGDEYVKYKNRAPRFL
jgi:protein-S-isoprenylcysteine O-methyltransferase Ste14